MSKKQRSFTSALVKAIKETEVLWKDEKVDSERLADRARENNLVLDAVISEIGWPTISQVGEEAAYYAYLIALQTEDVTKQLGYLLLLSQNRDDIDVSWLAYLTDRVCVRQGRPQEFGTQFADQGDKLVLRKVKDWQEMEQNRKLANLEPIEEYAQELAESSGVEVVLTKTKSFKPKK
ncbi:MAG: hypothetical protein JNK26_00245 [Candidatus Doudnabacteria bacterium]|nr:hypothetical protein [Candidatus Doudnabacteria bacterium]